MEKIKIQNMEGIVEEYDLLNSFGIKDISKDFMILTKNETSGEGMTKVYVSEVIEETPGILKLKGIADDATWQQVKIAMKEIAQGGK